MKILAYRQQDTVIINYTLLDGSRTTGLVVPCAITLEESDTEASVALKQKTAIAAFLNEDEQSANLKAACGGAINAAHIILL